MKLIKSTDGNRNDSYNMVGDAQDIRKMFGSLVKPDPEKWSVYYKAVRAGWLKPFTNPYFVRNPSVVSIPILPAYNPMHVKLLRSMQKTETPGFLVDWEQLERTSELLDYQEDFLEYSFNQGCEPQVGDWYELAKFIVPPKRVGFVRNIQTGLFWHNTGVNGLDGGWRRGDASTNADPINFQDSGPLAEWHLRIEPFGNNVDPTNNRILQELPGLAFNKLPTWRLMRFLWAVENNVYWIIPSNSVLSLWVGKYEVTPGQPQNWRQVAGLLQGATQPEGSKQTFRNVTRAW